MSTLSMQALEAVAKTRDYLDYVERHINNVAKAYDQITVAMERTGGFPVIYDDYRWHALREEVQRHDLSKLSPEEFVQYRLMFYPTESEKKESAQRGFDEAWQHHWENNHHHWEKWAGTDYHNPYEPEIHCTHMVIDWLAMSYEFGDTPRAYYEKNREKIELPGWAVDYINDLFDALDNQKA
jgi:hypothetical protein